MKVFVSYAHEQGAWVGGRLVPVLKAGGAEVLIDHQRFEAGLAVVGQMDGLQDHESTCLNPLKRRGSPLLNSTAASP